jgi:hypothetical protein
MLKRVGEDKIVFVYVKVHLYVSWINNLIQSKFTEQTTLNICTSKVCWKYKAKDFFVLCMDINRWPKKDLPEGSLIPQLIHLVWKSRFISQQHIYDTLCLLVFLTAANTISLVNKSHAILTIIKPWWWRVRNFLYKKQIMMHVDVQWAICKQKLDDRESKHFVRMSELCMVDLTLFSCGKGRENLLWWPMKKELASILGSSRTEKTS